MSLEKVKAYFADAKIADRIREFSVSSATVPLAAAAIGCEEGRIAKTLSFSVGDKTVLIVAAGDAKIDNRKFKDFFHVKAKMLPHDEVCARTGHDIGGVCPFCVNDGVDIYLDESLRRFDTVYPAAGSANSAIELTIPEMQKYSNAIGWTDIYKLPENS